MSNDNTAKPTEGQWKAIVSEVASCVGRDRVTNSRIVLEAGTVYHETGLTPRQLLDKLTAAEASDAESIAMYRRTRDRAQRVACEIEQQRDEFLKALQEIVLNDPYKKSAAGRVAAHAIAKVEAKP